LGLELRNPLLASASPLSNTVTGCRQLADAGVGAIVLPSLFEEQVAEQARRDANYDADSYHESLGLYPTVAMRDAGARRYLSLLSHAAEAVDVPVIGSLNGVTPEGWTGFATAMQDSGAAAIELNVYYLPGDPRIPGHDIEHRLVEILERVKSSVSIPVAVKLSPQLSSPGELVVRLDRAGADGLVLFNRFMYPDIDAETIDVTMGPTLSEPAEARLPRIWIALLRHVVNASLAGTTGVAQAADVVSYLLAGADAVMTASALLRHGPQYATVLLDGLTDWMRRKRFSSIGEFRSRLAVATDVDATAYQRDRYVKAMRVANVRTPVQSAALRDTAARPDPHADDSGT
jgi:dihydroorotate dehydrogenase (fumarate)